MKRQPEGTKESKV